MLIEAIKRERVAQRIFIKCWKKERKKEGTIREGNKTKSTEHQLAIYLPTTNLSPELRTKERRK